MVAVGESGESDVLVVGGGPSGLFAAVELAHHGAAVRIVEREPIPHRQARATALQPATLEILQQAGVADQVLESSEHLGYARVSDAGLRCVAELAFAGVGCPWEFQCSLPQWRTEQIAADGAILVRPDGYIGFLAAPAGHAGLTALDSHLDSYLVPASPWPLR